MANQVRNGRLHIQFYKPSAIVIYNARGQVMVKQRAETGLQIINVHSLVRGVYIVKAGSETQRFIIE
jgi:hypothetical protein